MKTITPAEFARAEKISPARVSQLMKGILQPAIVRVPGKKRVLLNWQKASALYRAYSDPAKQRDRAKNSEYTEARLLNMEYQNKLLAAKIEKKREKYIAKSTIRERLFKASRLFHERMLNIAPRIAAIVAAETDEIKCIQIIDFEIRQSLKNLADDLDKSGI